MASFRVLRPTTRPVATGGRSVDELAAASCVVGAVIAAAPRQFLSGQLASQPEDDRGTTTPCNEPATDDAPGLRYASSAGRHTEGGHA
jgi:hypothetical protein